MDEMTWEREYLSKGYRRIAGVDEVGRGPLAGPVVACAVILPFDCAIEGIDDSKRLSKKRREELAEIIRAQAVDYCIAEVDEETIDKINILQATRLCMKRAVEALAISPDLVLSDGNMHLDIAMPQESIIKGDALVYSIGAASILAKVYRDARMREYAEKYPGYGFERNVGYGTAEHIAAIRERGLCTIHRKTFVKKFWDGKERT